LPVDIEVSYRVSNEPAGTAQSRDLSAGGVCVVLLERYEPGTTVEIKLVMPDSNETVNATGRILRTEEYTIGDSKAYDTGIEFLDIGDAQQERIEAFASSPLYVGPVKKAPDDAAEDQ